MFFFFGQIIFFYIIIIRDTEKYEPHFWNI